MEPQHVDPEQAVQIHMVEKELKPKINYFLHIHTFTIFLRMLNQNIQ